MLQSKLLKFGTALLMVLILAFALHYFIFPGQDNAEGDIFLFNEEEYLERVDLPDVSSKGELFLEEAFEKRRSTREYKDKPLSLEHVSQLLWAAQGITEEEKGFRTSPSAGALYPLEVYVAAGRVTGLTEGLYNYNPHEHELLLLRKGDYRDELYNAALNQSPVLEAPAVIAISSVDERITGRYGSRGIRYADMEAGHVSQNIYLQAVSLELGTVAIGAFDDEGIGEIIGMKAEERPLYLMPVGIKK